MIFKQRWVRAATAIASTVITAASCAQAPSPVANATLLQDSLRESVLTEGHQPFHLILEIAPDETLFPHRSPAQASMHATVELFWAARDRYKLVLKSSTFSQTRIVDGITVEEHDEGDFYPRWLDNFIHMLLDPVPHEQLPKLLQKKLSEGGSIHVPGRAVIYLPRCLGTSDRPGGITEETSVASMCFDPANPWYQSTSTFTHYVSFADFEKFAGQRIPRTWSDDIPQNIQVSGKVTLLEKLSKTGIATIHVVTPTPLSGQIKTVFLSRAGVQSHIDTIPEFEWPAENTEALEGYMIVYVRTDRTGTIRESYWDSSDNYKLQDAGVQLALKSKLKPLFVDGAPVQIEGPLVLHFKTHRSDAANPLN